MAPEPRVVVRYACPEDAALLLKWRNEPWIVESGASRRTVSEDEHRAWFAATLDRTVREVFLIEVDAVPAGMVRYDLPTPGEAEISIFLMPAYWSRGFGSEVFWRTASDLCVRRRLRRIVARVLAENSKSQRFFARLGFRHLDTAASSGLLEYALDVPVVPHSRPWIAGDELASVGQVLNSRMLAAGPVTRELESRWCTLTGAAAAAAVGSGLGALRLTLVAMGIGPGDDVVIPAYSCVALPNAALAVGATPVLADVAPDRWTLRVDDVGRRITSRTKAIVAVHLFGTAADMVGLAALGIPVIENCTHGVGSFGDGTPFGSKGAANMASFYATKMIGAGSGGIVGSRDVALVERIRRARDYDDQPPDGRRLNDKTTDIASAIAVGMLDRLPGITARRRALAAGYDRLLQPLVGQSLIALPEDVTGRTWYRYAVRLLRHRASSLVDKITTLGVRAEQPVWDLRGTTLWRNGLGGTDLAFDTLVSLPLYPDLTAFEQRMVVTAFARALEDDRL